MIYPLLRLLQKVLIFHLLRPLQNWKKKKLQTFRKSPLKKLTIPLISYFQEYLHPLPIARKFRYLHRYLQGWKFRHLHRYLQG
jgi:hypothetical protein